MAERHELLMELLREVNKLVFDLVQQEIDRPDLGAAHLLIMSELASHPGSSVSQLARAVGLAKSHVSTTVEQLSRKGWLEKQADASDLRLVRIYPTNRSKEQFRLIAAAVRQRMNAALSAMPIEQVDDLLQGLAALREILSHGEQSQGVQALTPVAKELGGGI